jgi:hypothetical protein
LSLSEFVEEWYRLESVEPQPPEPLPQRTEVTTIFVEPIIPPVTPEQPQSPPADEPSGDVVQSTGFSRKPLAKQPPPEGGTQNNIKPKSLSTPPLRFRLSRRAWLIGSAIGLPATALMIYVGTHLPSSKPVKMDASPTPTCSPISTPKPYGNFTENLNGVCLEMMFVQAARSRWDRRRAKTAAADNGARSRSRTALPADMVTDVVNRFDGLPCLLRRMHAPMFVVACREVFTVMAAAAFLTPQCGVGH